MLLPGLMAVTGVEELLFRQILFRWLEQQNISSKGTILATAVAFGGAHLGPLLIGGEVDGLFYLLQSVYMVWVGLLLGELRRASESWVISWAGHAGYNTTFLFVLSLIDDV
ncbi:MAG: CPBP family intramembrane metalloprotease [Nitrospira sp.]|nr:CPBP family intramembrane metalloprotease [Nitrospira sp.]